MNRLQLVNTVDEKSGSGKQDFVTQTIFSLETVLKSSASCKGQIGGGAEN